MRREKEQQAQRELPDVTLGEGCCPCFSVKWSRNQGQARRVCWRLAQEHLGAASWVPTRPHRGGSSVRRAQTEDSGSGRTSSGAPRTPACSLLAAPGRLTAVHVPTQPVRVVMGAGVFLTSFSVTVLCMAKAMSRT